MADLKQNQQEILDELDYKPNLNVKKREDYIDWDEYFLAVSILSAQRSKDPSTQVKSKSKLLTYEI
jgi:deoxycytidylate deaminase